VFDLNRLLVCDVETDALFGYTKIHVITTSTLDGKETVYEQPTKYPRERERFLKDIKGLYLCGHNFLGFDLRALRDLLKHRICEDYDVLDTLIVSRLLNYSLKGGHSLEAWGERLGIKKEGVDIKDWSTYTPLMRARNISDARINVALVKRFRRFLEDPAWRPALRTEHDIVWRQCNRMTETGVPFNTERALELIEMLTDRLLPIEQALHTDFPPKVSFIRTITPRKTQKGTWNAQDFRWSRNNNFTFDPDTNRVTLSGVCPDRDPDLSWVTGEPFDLCELVPFNPGSPKQVVERLNEAGWKPTEKTDGHLDILKDRKADPERKAYFKEYGWKVSETNLKTLPDTAPDSAKKLAQRLVLSSRLADLKEWVSFVQEDGRIHGRYNGLGAWTHRVSHNSPNTANIPVAKRSDKDNEFERFVNDINDEMRRLFVAPKGMRLIGTDADGIQMRIFAHLVGDQRLIDALVKGDKKDGTDIHSVHQRALGAVCKSRDAAKTFIYAFLLGAGVAKVAEILECTFSEAKEAVSNFLNFYPGLKDLKEKVIPNDAARGYFIGLDGRKVACDSEHLMLAGYLQNGEKVIMSLAGLMWQDELDARNIPYEFLLWVHDEWQIAIEDNDDLAKEVSDIQIQAFHKVGELLNMKCPLEGTTTIHNGFIGGYTWQETH
jgi:DNA polymerase-1